MPYVPSYTDKLQLLSDQNALTIELLLDIRDLLKNPSVSQIVTGKIILRERHDQD